MAESPPPPGPNRVKLAASVIFSTNTFTNNHKYFAMAGVAWISKSRFYELQKKYLFGVANEAWKNYILLLIHKKKI